MGPSDSMSLKCGFKLPAPTVEGNKRIVAELLCLEPGEGRTPRPHHHRGPMLQSIVRE